jgi:1,4-alpha-glucan branching enzyme
VAIVSNFTPEPRVGYRVPLPRDGTWLERINTDAHDYGGSGVGNLGMVVAKDGHAEMTLPPLATLVFSCQG